MLLRGDGVRLVNCLGVVDDTLLYGDLMAFPDEDEGLLDDLGNESFAQPDSTVCGSYSRWC